MPAWLHHKPHKRQIFEPMKIRIDYAPSMTWMRKDQSPPMPRTDHMKELPPCMEVCANAALWDPFGTRWGRGAHWPLLASIGTGRYRSNQMKDKRAKKKKDKRDTGKGKGKAKEGKGKANQGKGKDTPKVVLTPRCAGGGQNEASSSSFEGARPSPQSLTFAWLNDSDDGQPMAKWGPYHLKWTKHGEWIARINGCWWALRGCDPMQIDWEDAHAFWCHPAE